MSTAPSFLMCSALLYLLLPLLLLEAANLALAARGPSNSSGDNSDERQFVIIRKDQIACSNDETLERLNRALGNANCSGTSSSVSPQQDCILAEIESATGRPAPSSSRQQSNDWNSLARLMQELANEDPNEAEYPEGMDVLPPLSNVRRRVCPVRYVTALYGADTLPMVMVHATCLHERGWVNGKSVKCREVQHFRQVYRRIKDCHANVTDAAGGRATSVYVKDFVSVNVNCAAIEA